MRMIDADALYDKAESAYKNAPWQIRSTCRWFVDSIADAPTVDAVEVVRCKDCDLQYGCKVGQYLGNDGFCSLGERRRDG